jgi:uncharacterized protein DUF4129
MTDRQRRTGTRAVRRQDTVSLGKLGMLGVFLVLVAGAARARDVDVPVQLPSGLGGLFDLLVEAGGLAVVAGGLVLVLAGGRERVEDDVTGTPVNVRPVTTKLTLRWRAVFAAASGVSVALVFFLVSRLLAPRIQGGPPGETNGVSGPPEGRVSVGDLGHGPSGMEIAVYVSVACLAVATLAVAFLRMRAAGQSSRESPSEADGLEAVAELVRVGKAAMSDHSISDPREAVIACFDSMERALSTMTEAVRPRDADTAQEVLRRAVRVARLPSRPAEELLSLFHRAQFSSHPMARADRDAAEAVLDELLDSCGLRATGHRGGGS